MDPSTYTRAQSAEMSPRVARENTPRCSIRTECRSGETQQRADILDLLIRELQLVRVETGH